MKNLQKNERESKISSKIVSLLVVIIIFLAIFNLSKYSHKSQKTDSYGDQMDDIRDAVGTVGDAAGAVNDAGSKSSKNIIQSIKKGNNNHYDSLTSIFKTEKAKRLEEKELLKGGIDFVEGKVTHHIPDSMQLKELKKVSMSIGKELDILIERTFKLSEAKVRDQIKTESITIGRKMTATLTDPMASVDKIFEITPITNESQLVDIYNNPTVDWIWNVLPLQNGKHELSLNLDVVIKNDLGENFISIPIFNDKVMVYINQDNIPLAYGMDEPSASSSKYAKKELSSKTVAYVQTEGDAMVNDFSPDESPEKIQYDHQSSLVSENNPFHDITFPIWLLAILFFMLFGYMLFFKLNAKRNFTNHIRSNFTKEDVEGLEDLCKQNQIEKALELIISKLPTQNSKFRKEVMLNSSNLKQISKDHMLNVISFDDYSRMSSKIALTTLNLTGEIKVMLKIEADTAEQNLLR